MLAAVFSDVSFRLLVLLFMVCGALAGCGNCERRVFGRAGRIFATSAERVTFFYTVMVSILRNRRGSVHLAQLNFFIFVYFAYLFLSDFVL